MTKAININKTYENFFKTIAGTSDAKDKLSINNSDSYIFKHRYDLIRFAAAIGYHFDTREKLSSDSITLMDARLVSTQKDLVDDVNIMAVAISGSEDIYNADNEEEREKNLSLRYDIYQEFLNGGLNKLYEWYSMGAINPHELIIEKLLDEKIIEEKKIDNKLKVEIASSKRKRIRAPKLK